MMRKAAIGLAMLLLAGLGVAQQPGAEKQASKGTTPEALQADIEALKVAGGGRDVRLLAPNLAGLWLGPLPSSLRDAWPGQRRRNTRNS